MSSIQIDGIHRAISGYNVCYPHAGYVFGNVTNFIEYAKTGLYPMYCWNGRIYTTSDMKDTGFLFDDIL